MKRRYSKHALIMTIAAALLVTSATPRGVFGIKGLSPVHDAEAQLLGGGGGGMMQMLPQLLMLMMMMQMMNQNKNDSASGKVKKKRDGALRNLQEAGGQSSGTPSRSPLTPPSRNPLTPPGPTTGFVPLG